MVGGEIGGNGKCRSLEVESFFFSFFGIVLYVCCFGVLFGWFFFYFFKFRFGGLFVGFREDGLVIASSLLCLEY